MLVPAILELKSKTKYGITSRHIPIYLARPLDTELPLCIAGSSHKDVSSNILVLLNVDAWNSIGLTRASIVRVIGKCGDFAAEMEAISLRYLPPKRASIPLLNAPVQGDRKVIDSHTFNIDPAGCIDIDDVVTIYPNGQVYITIADVSEWFVINPDLQVSQGQTFYKNGVPVRPMLPFEQECSLLPGQWRAGVSLGFTWRDKTISDISFEKTWIRNNRSYTYENVGEQPVLQEIVSFLAGRTVLDSHEWIEQLMIFYNKSVAERIDGIMRVHDEPDMEKLEKYASIEGLDMKFLAYKAARYSTTKQRHWGLGLDAYCHASSPIRRYADVINQAILKGDKPPPFSVDELTLYEKAAKKYERDTFFLEAVQGPSREVWGLSVSSTRVWVPAWKRLVSCKNTGGNGTLKYSLDMNQTTWKRRMVFNLCGDTGCPE